MLIHFCGESLGRYQEHFADKERLGDNGKKNVWTAELINQPKFLLDTGELIIGVYQPFYCFVSEMCFKYG